MFCPKCEKEIVKKAVFCPYCGTRLSPPSDLGENTQNAENQAYAPVTDTMQQNGTPSVPYETQQQFQQIPQQNQYQQAPPPPPPPPQPQAPQYRQFQNQYQQPQMQAAVPQKKKISKIVIPVSIIAVVLIAAAVLLLVFKPWESEDDSLPVSAITRSSEPDFTKPPANTSSAAVITAPPDGPMINDEEPSFTVNNKEVPLDICALGYGRVDTGTDGFYACFIGKTDDEIFGINAMFMPGYPQANTEFNLSDFDDNMAVFFAYSGEDYESYSDVYYDTLNIASYGGDMSDVQIAVGDFVPNEYITIAVSGKISYDGLKYDFSASGKLDFVNNAEALITDWYSANRIPAERSNEVLIGGEYYSADLTFLDLSGKGLYDEDLDNLIYMTKLERIELSDNNLSDISILRNIPSLTEIDANNNYISDISFLKDLPNMEIVVMNNNMINDISVFRNFSTIKKIWMCDNFIDDISYIAKNKRMTELGFNNCKIGDLSAVKEMSKLQMLHAAYCGITDISPLSDCTSLTELNLSGNDISDYSPIENLNIENIYY